MAGLARSMVAFSVVLLFGTTGCGNDRKTIIDTADVTPPAVPPAAAAAALSPTSIQLTWTAPGDDHLEGQATAYEVRYSTSTITDSTFISAIAVIQVPAPAVAGTLESVAVTDLDPGTLYHFGIRAVDDAANRSDIAIASAATLTIPPAAARWSDVLTGNSVNGIVNALTIYEDALIVGGQFTTAGATNAQYAARWTGSDWQAFAIDPPGVVWALAVHDGNLVAGGSFGGTESTVGNIQRWDGATWSSMGAGLNNVVRALTVFEGDLIAGGLFTASTDSVPMNYVSRWNGTAWLPLGDGVGGPVSALLVKDGQLFAGGFSGIHLWNGTTWDRIGEGDVSALAAFEGDVIAGGDFEDIGLNVARWNGASWSGLGAGLNRRVLALGVYHDRLFAGGGFTLSGADTVNRVAEWNGISWQPLDTGVDKLVNVFQVFQDALYVGGSFRLAGDIESRGLARWEE